MAVAARCLNRSFSEVARRVEECTGFAFWLWRQAVLRLMRREGSQWPMFWSGLTEMENQLPRINLTKPGDLLLAQAQSEGNFNFFRRSGTA